MTGKEISLYFHIPFCSRKCDYCHFFVLPDKEESKDRLYSAFCLEWTLLEPLLEDNVLRSLYFGGGTPSLFSPKRIQGLINLIKKTISFDPNIEITLEANPENITFDLMKAYFDVGVNRVSIGVQTLEPSLLKLLGRTHTEHAAIEAIMNTHASGFENISIDLMYDLPHQTLSHWKNTLSQITPLPITHVSLYNLTLEPHTVFFKRREELTPLLPPEDISLEMLEWAVSELEASGLKRYEISAFAKQDYFSRHNVGYWTGRPFFGLGPSAFSYFQGKRERNIAHLNKYCQMLNEGQLPRDFSEKLDEDAQRREHLVIQLRLIKGVNLSDFENSFGALDSSTKQELIKLQQEELIKIENSLIRLTPRGLLFYDFIAERLI